MSLPEMPFHFAVRLTWPVLVPSTVAVTGKLVVALIRAARFPATSAATSVELTTIEISWPAI